MSGINTGILTNAYPLTAEQIRELERQVLEEQQSFAYLNENSELCFVLPWGINIIKDLAWNKAYEINAEENLVTKATYSKTGLDTYKSNGAEGTVASFTEEANELGTTIII